MRCFISAEISDAAKEEFLQALAKADMEGFRLVRKEHMHITLKFLGDIGEQELEQCKNAVDGCALGAHIIARLEKGGAFANTNSARVVFVNCVSHELEKIASCIRKFTQGIGDEKPFVGHITVARAKDRPMNASNLMRALESITREETISEICIFESTLTPEGPVYRKLHSRKLG